MLDIYQYFSSIKKLEKLK